MKNDREKLTALYEMCNEVVNQLRPVLNSPDCPILEILENHLFTLYSITSNILELPEPDLPGILDDKTIQFLKKLFDHYQHKQRFDLILSRVLSSLIESKFYPDHTVAIGTSFIITDQVVKRLEELDK